MGACCTKKVMYRTDSMKGLDDNYDYNYNYDCEYKYKYDQVEGNDDNLTKGDFGALVRVSGSSKFVSMATRKGNKEVNQDAMTVWEDFLGEKDVFFCGVFDGHGANGHKVSRRVRDNLPSKLADKHLKMIHTQQLQLLPVGSKKNRTHGCFNCHAENDTNENEEEMIGDDDDDDQNRATCVMVNSSTPPAVYNSWKTNFETAFKEMDKDLSYDTNIDHAYSSGATAVTVVKQGNDLVIGNLGDSRAVLCRRGIRGQPIPVQLTVDLKPTIKSEAERIKHCKGRIFGFNNKSRILRVWQPDARKPGLAMTRAFGDFCLKDYGLISTPQLFYKKLTENDEFVVLASDGIWDVLSNLEVVKLVDSVRDRSDAAEVLVSYASRAWRTRHPRARADDIAVVCLFFKDPRTRKMIESESELSHNTTSTVSWLVSAINSRKNSNKVGYDDDEEKQEQDRG